MVANTWLLQGLKTASRFFRVFKRFVFVFLENLSDFQKDDFFEFLDLFRFFGFFECSKKGHKNHGQGA